MFSLKGSSGPLNADFQEREKHESGMIKQWVIYSNDFFSLRKRKSFHAPVIEKAFKSEFKYASIPESTSIY